MTVKSKIIFTTVSLFAVAGIGATAFVCCSSDANKVEQTAATTIPTTLAALELGYKDGNKVIEIEEGGAVKAADLPIECAGAGKLAIVYSDNTAEKTFEKSGDYSVTAEVTDLSTGRVGTIAFTVRVSAPQTKALTTTAKATQAHTQAKTTKKSASGSNSGTSSKKAQPTTKKATTAPKTTKKSSSSSAKPKSTTKKSSSGSSGSGKDLSEQKMMSMEEMEKILLEQEWGGDTDGCGRSCGRSGRCDFGFRLGFDRI